MAENDSSQEKTEEPTAKRIEKAREQGEVPRSRELNTSAILIVAAVAFLALGPQLIERLRGITLFNFAFDRAGAVDPTRMGPHLLRSLYEALWAVAPLFALLVLAALFGPMVLGGWNASSKAIMPQLSRINPLAGLKRMLSLQAWVELIKSWLKTLLIGGVGVLMLWSMRDELLSLLHTDMEQALAQALWVLGTSFTALCLCTLLILAIDLPFQISSYQRKLRMTLQEIKDEFKNTEGKPEVKSRIRQLQRQMSQRRMMAAVPKADVVITNPEHYAVALTYNQQQTAAPILVAKGVDSMALNIQQIAREHSVPVLREPPLARAIYHHTQIDGEIPEGLYLAVAQVLAYLYQLQQWRKGLADNPGQRPKVQVPPSLQVDD